MMYDRLEIKKMVCSEFKIRLNQLQSGKRGVRQVSDAKGVYAYITRKYLRDTVIRISMELNIEHTTVTRKLQRVDEFFQIRDPIIKSIERIEHKLLNNPHTHENNDNHKSQHTKNKQSTKSRIEASRN